MMPRWLEFWLFKKVALLLFYTFLWFNSNLMDCQLVQRETARTAAIFTPLKLALVDKNASSIAAHRMPPQTRTSRAFR